MSREKLHIGQAFYLPQLLDELRQSGVNTDRLIQKTTLRHFDVTESDLYIPLIGMYELLELLQRDQGIDQLLTQFYHLFALTPHNNVARQILQSPNLLHVMQIAVKFQHLSKTNYQISLEIDGNQCTYAVHQELQSKIFDKSSKGWMIEQDIDLVRTLDTITLAAGKDWSPQAIYLTRSSLDGIEFMLPSGDYPVHLNQETNKLVLDTTILASEMPKLPGEQFKLDLQETSLSTRLEKLLTNQVPGTSMSLVDTSELMNTSTRTLQRILRAEGTNFSEIALRVRFLKAIELLNQGMHVREISQHLGYEESSNFVRAFKAWAGISPGAYQNQQGMS